MANMITKTNVLVVVPAFNESLSIGTVLSSLMSHGYSVLVVNDCSTDETSRIAITFGVAVLELPINLGVGGALRAGFQYAVNHGFEAVIQVDADGQHPIDKISELISASNELDADMVIGSRFLDHKNSMHVSDSRRLVMRILAWSASRATSTKITDATSGFRIIRQPLLGKFSRKFAANYLGDTYEALIAAGRSGYRVREIPAPITDRLNGVSSSSSFKSIAQTLKVMTVAVLKIHTKV